MSAVVGNKQPAASVALVARGLGSPDRAVTLARLYSDRDAYFRRAYSDRVVWIGEIAGTRSLHIGDARVSKRINTVTRSRCHQLLCALTRAYTETTASRIAPAVKSFARSRAALAISARSASSVSRLASAPASA